MKHLPKWAIDQKTIVHRIFFKNWFKLFKYKTNHTIIESQSCENKIGDA